MLGDEFPLLRGKISRSTEGDSTTYLRAGDERGAWASGQRAMLYNRTIDRFLIVTIPAGLFVYASTRPILRLRADMPQQFVDAPASASAKHRAAEERLARAYWNCAVTSVQWRHSYGSPLPDMPPAEFRIDEKAATASEAVSVSRLRYWHRLQSLWLSPEVWTASREWSMQWVTEPIAQAFGGIGDYFANLFKAT